MFHFFVSRINCRTLRDTCVFSQRVFAVINPEHLQDRIYGGNSVNIVCYGGERHVMRNYQGKFCYQTVSGGNIVILYTSPERTIIRRIR